MFLDTEMMSAKILDTLLTPENGNYELSIVTSRHNSQSYAVKCQTLDPASLL